MKVIILAAGQGTRLRPLTDECPKCMVKINGISIIERQIEVMKNCGIKEEDVFTITGYRNKVLEKHLSGSKINFLFNAEYETTNMVFSLMSAEKIMKESNDILVSYGDIIYTEQVLNAILNSKENISVIVDDGWYSYWSLRCDDVLEDAETLMYDRNDTLIEIGQKTDDLNKIQAQYIGLMRYKGEGLQRVLQTVYKAQKRSKQGIELWRTSREYRKMYMTDLLQGMIEEGEKLKAIHINRGWYEVDNIDDLKIVEKELGE